VFRSAYLRNGFDKLFGYQYHLSGDIAGTALNASYACLILALQPIWRLLGWTRRSMKNSPLERRWKGAWVDLACNETDVGE